MLVFAVVYWKNTLPYSAEEIKQRKRSNVSQSTCYRLKYRTIELHRINYIILSFYAKLIYFLP